MAPAGAGVAREQWAQLRRFHLGDSRAGESLQGVEGCLPALLSPYREVARLRFDYPLLLHNGIPGLPRDHPDQVTMPLADFLQAAVSSIGPKTAGKRILEDNLPRLEGTVQAVLEGVLGPVAAADLLAEAGERLQDKLALDDKNRSHLAAALTQTIGMLPPSAELLGYGRHAAMYLLLHALRHRVIPRHERFLETVHELAKHLRSLLTIERAKTDTIPDLEDIEGRVGSAGTWFLDAAALARVVHHGRGSEQMSPQGRRRVEEALNVLEAYLQQAEVQLVTVLHSGLLSGDIRNGDLPVVLYTTARRRYLVKVQTSLAPCIEAQAVFDEATAALARVVSAVRMAQLEVDRLYEPTAYEPWLEPRSWQDFTWDELLLAPAVVALVSADLVAGDGMRAVSRLLRSGRPVQMVVEVDPSANVGRVPEEPIVTPYRLEIGYFGLSHRQAAVHQCTAAHPQHLITGYLLALDAACSGLHIVSVEGTGASDGAGAPLHPWLLARSAIESRAHPLFHFQPVGRSEQERLPTSGHVDLQDNPQPEDDWPAYKLRYLERDGTERTLALRFTFADFALLEPSLRRHFRLLPEGLEIASLVPADTYSLLASDAARQCLPFIWVVDAEGNLRRALVTRELLRVAQDRQNYWRTLQAFAGIRNPFIEQARRQALAEAEARAAAEREQLEARHRDELERVRKGAARQAMRRLTEVLLGLDLTARPPRTTGAPLSPLPDLVVNSPPEDSVASSPSEPEMSGDNAAADQESLGEGPWIDTPLCTSCNDCFAVNPRLFAYDENKQAHIADPLAGTYAELVEAAERCPARCIHPGKPLNPAAPGIDVLIARAAPFN